MKDILSDQMNNNFESTLAFNNKKTKNKNKISPNLSIIEEKRPLVFITFIDNFLIKNNNSFNTSIIVILAQNYSLKTELSIEMSELSW